MAERHTHRKKSKRWIPVVYFWIFFAYMELIFHILVFHSLSFTLVFPLVFILAAGAVFGTLCRIFPGRVNRILMLVFTALFCVMYLAAGISGHAFSSVINGILIVLLLLILPLAFVVLFAPRFFTVRRVRTVQVHLLTLGLGIVLHIFLLLLLLAAGRGSQAAYEMYFHDLSAGDDVKTLGVMAADWCSVRNAVFGSSGTSDTDDQEQEAVERPVDTSPNTLEIDFDQILEEADQDADVEQLCTYIQGQPGTDKNAYTGMFAGYNLIWITADGLDKYAISKELMPTLYQMETEGFVFSHYYSPLYYGSTSGGEWANLTGTVPNNGSYVSMTESGERSLDMLFTPSRQALRLGYYTTGWHNNTYTNNGRDVSFPNMGFAWYGADQGYDPETNEATGKALWPQSDERLIRQSFPEYSENEPFMTYYMTNSGHAEYSWSSNAMSKKNREAVEAAAEEYEWDYSDTTLAYLAANLELEYAMEELLSDLAEAGIADRTLIVLAPDCVPYDDMDVIDELAGEELDEIEAYQNTLIIYSPAMEQRVNVQKYCCSVDILPTVSNLMGWDFDSRMLVGQDILSDAEQFIMFPGLSFIDGKIKYNAKEDKAVYLSTEEDKDTEADDEAETETEAETEAETADVDDTYIKDAQDAAYNWYTISDLLFSTDFYKYVEPQMPAVSGETKEPASDG